MAYIYDESWTEEEIFARAEELEGMKLGDLDKSGWLNDGRNKGRVGNMIQQDFFGIAPNSDKNPDFIYHGIELKATPVLKHKSKGFSSKERLVLSMINYEKDHSTKYLNSDIFKKTKSMLLVFYLHEENKKIEDFEIIKTTRFILPEEDNIIVEQDYISIINKILAGEAHLISESQQDILGACRKGSGKEGDLKDQPFSKIKAKSRAYSYKVGYMSSFVRRLLVPDKVDNIKDVSESSLEEYVFKVLNRNIGRKYSEICKEVGFTSTSKSKLFSVITYLFGLNGKNINQTQQFLKAGLSIKTVTNRISRANNQDMSFPNIDYGELYYDEFEDSTWYGNFAETSYIFVLWDEIGNNDYILKKAIKWNADELILDDLESLYLSVSKILRENELMISKSINENSREKWIDNLPGRKGDNEYFQIRPKGTRDSNTVVLPNGMKMRKQSLFLNKEYIRSLFDLD